MSLNMKTGRKWISLDLFLSGSASSLSLVFSSGVNISEDDVNKIPLLNINYRGLHVHTDTAVELPECCLLLFHHTLHHWVW